jgi:DNA-binding response OmpR family regulator
VNKILIADDNRDFSAALKLALEAAGYIVYLAATGREAILAQRSTPADFLITDLLMPDTDGLEAVAAFRKEFPTVKIVVVSGAQRLDRLRYLETAKLIGADFTFQKPFEVEALLKALKSLRGP